MAITFVAAIGASFSGTASLSSIGEPAGSQNGDLLLYFMVTDTNHNTTGTPPTGWTKIGEQDSGTDTSMSVFRKIRSGVEAENWTNIFDATETGRVIMLGYRGVDQTTPMDAAAVFGTESATAWDTGSITTVTANAMCVAAFGADPASDPYTFAWDAGITERIDSDTTPTGQNALSAYIAIGDKIIVTPAATTLGGDCSVSDTAASVIIALRPASGGAFDITASPGTYALTGTAATVPAARLISSLAGAYTLTGVAASVPAGRAVTASPGAYALSGTAANLLASRSVTASPGTYAVTGAQASLLAGRILTAVPGAYVLTGIAAELALQGQLSISADPGAYALTGSPASLLATRIIVADDGAYVITGANASLIAERLVSALPGAYVLTGASVTFTYGVPQVTLWPTAIAPRFGEDTLGRILSPDLLKVK